MWQSIVLVLAAAAAVYKLLTTAETCADDTLGRSAEVTLVLIILGAFGLGMLVGRLL